MIADGRLLAAKRRPVVLANHASDSLVRGFNQAHGGLRAHLRAGGTRRSTLGEYLNHTSDRIRAINRCGLGPAQHLDPLDAAGIHWGDRWKGRLDPIHEYLHLTRSRAQ